MLVLTRRQNESILIGDDIVVSVLGFDHNRVRLGITAPDEVPILRDELADAMHRDAAGSGTEGDPADDERDKPPRATLRRR